MPALAPSPARIVTDYGSHPEDVHELAELLLGAEFRLARWSIVALKVEETGKNDWLHAAAAAVPAVVVLVGVLTIVVGAAATLKLSEGQLVGWMVALYALPGLLGAWLAVRHRQPLALTGNVFAIILFASEGDRLTFAELAGASVLAGVVVTILGVYGVTARLARWIPMPIVMGMLAGAVLPFVVRVFTSLDAAPLIVGGTVIAYLLALRALGQVAGLPVAIVAGVLLAAASGQLTAFAPPVVPALGLTAPSLSIAAIAAVTPVLVTIMTVQSNIPSLVFLRSQSYDPPERQVDVISGLATVVGSVLGPNAVSLPLPLMGVFAGPDAGPPAGRYRAAVVVGAALVLIGALGTVAVALLAVLPPPLIQALAGLALLRVLTSAVQTFARGPLILGPVLAMVVAQSSLTLLGLAPLFWALVIGIAVSTLLERDGLARLRDGGRERAS